MTPSVLAKQQALKDIFSERQSSVEPRMQPNWHHIENTNPQEFAKCLGLVEDDLELEDNLYLE